jgi:hypothetical protein
MNPLKLTFISAIAKLMLASMCLINCPSARGQVEVVPVAKVSEAPLFEAVQIPNTPPNVQPATVRTKPQDIHEAIKSCGLYGSGTLIVLPGGIKLFPLKALSSAGTGKILRVPLVLNVLLMNHDTSLAGRCPALLNQTSHDNLPSIERNGLIPAASTLK